MHGNGHKGIDLAGKTSGAALGKPIPNLMDGTVIQVFKNNPSAGNGVVIKGVDGRTYRYIHMRYAPNVKNGQKVAAGYNLGQIGSTGRSTGPHLDLKILDSKGNYIDPAKVLKSMAAGGGSQSYGGGSSKNLSYGLVGTGSGKAYQMAPSSVRTVINIEAQKQKVNPYLIASIIKQESAFKYNAGSGAGAKGYMQLMPATARSLGVTNVYDAGQNIAAGTKYIKQMIQKFGSIELGLAAYNAGPGNVNKAIRKAGGNKSWAAVSRYLPKETRNYVPKVMQYR